jgi:predicted Fe-Mo cluster-binding NifX family protein
MFLSFNLITEYLARTGGEEMTDILIIPTETQEGMSAQLAEHFGRAPYFTVIELGDKWEVASVKVLPNVSEHMGGTGVPPDHLAKLHPKAIIVQGMGPRGIMAFKSYGIEVLKANSTNIQELVESYKQGKLEDLSEGCPDAAHHH